VTLKPAKCGHYRFLTEYFRFFQFRAGIEMIFLKPRICPANAGAHEKRREGELTVKAAILP
jgi:hypothetical protein